MEERDIFFEAIEITDPEAQCAFLERVCAEDHALHNRLRDLLAMHDGAGNFMKRPAIDQIIKNFAVPPCSESADCGQVVLSSGGFLRGTNDGADERPSEISLSFLQASTRDDSLGRLGNYEVLQILGRGAFGIVLKAFDDKLRRMVAIKVISPALLSNLSVRQRFLREARAFAAVRDPNTVQIHAIEEEPVPALVMEYVPGQTIQQRIEERGPMSVREVLQIGRQIACGLAAAHAVGLIHRDIKPANILLEDGGDDWVKITDFGLARALEGDNLTQTEVIAGTPMFMSPEQALGNPFDQRTDLFSLGSVLYLMLSGRPPFQATSTTGLLKRVVEDPPRPIQEIVPTAPEWLCKIVDRLHAKKPDDRFGSAREVADLLNRCLIDFDRGEVPSLVGVESPTIPTTMRLRHGRWSIVVLGTLLVITVSILSIKQRHLTQIVDTSTSKIDSVERDADARESSVTSIELGPRIQPGNLGDGLITDLSFRDRVLSLDATTGSHQLWVNFPDVYGEELTISTEFREVGTTEFGIGKLIFMPDLGQQLAAVIVFGPKGYEVYFESSTETIPDSNKVRFQGAAATEWNELKFEISAEKYSYTFNGKLVMERPRESRHSGYVAISCISSRCEMKDLRVLLKRESEFSGIR